MSNHSQRAILLDLKRKTGYSFQGIDNICSSQADIASVVLPVLREWVWIPDETLRCAIYMRFRTEHARPYLDDIIQWWTKEPSPFCSFVLAQVAESLIDAVAAKPVWLCWKELHQKPAGSYRVLARLARFPSTKVEVTAAIAAALNQGLVPVDDLDAVQTVRDERIRLWFISRLASDDPRIARLAKRVAGHGVRLPERVCLAREGPNKAQEELFSAEIDLAELPRVRDRLEKQFGVACPAMLEEPQWLSGAPLDRWMKMEVASAGHGPMVLWFRLEDVDVVEVVLTGESGACGSGRAS